MLKGFGFLIVVLSASLMGYIKCIKLSKRVNFLTEYLQFINYLEAEFRYSSALIQDLIDKYDFSNTLNEFLLCINKNMSTGQTLSESWSLALVSIKESFGLNKEDFELIHNFGNSLGSSDTKSQISYCKMNKKLVSSRIDLALNDKEKKGKLYFILYFFAGLSTVLFFM